MLTDVYKRQQGVLLLDFKEPGVNLNAERYADSLKRLRASIKNKRLGKLTNGVILMYDNARPRVAQTIQDLLGRMKRKAL